MKTIYLDTPATSHFKPRCVKKAFLKYLSLSANPGRSGHELSVKNAAMIWQTRETLARQFGNIEPENVIFTKNATEALNIAILGLCKKNKGKNVICSCFEHNSVLRPLHHLENLGEITLTIVSPKNKKFITAHDISLAIKDNTFLVCLTAISNVTGNKNDFEDIGKLCHKKGILFLLDDAQGVGHIKVDMKNSHINFLAFSGHKGLHTPQGIGVLCINSKFFPAPIIFGGTGTESENLLQPKIPPECFESGTIASPLIASLFAGAKYIEKHFEKHLKKIASLTQYIIKKLREIEGVKIYSDISSTYGVVAFSVAGFDSIEVTDFLNDKYHIASRGGLHCAPLTHKFLGTLESGLTRVGVDFKNSYHDINILAKAIKQLSQISQLKR
jgi:cysteine desulfurase / selenocysteine lyase